RVKAGDRVIVIDNAKHGGRKKEVASQVLERSITDSTLNFRHLGSNTSISRGNDVIFCLTMNCTRLGADLRRRNIPINLEASGDLRSRKFSIPNLEHFVQEHRYAIIAELAGMVTRWVAAGRPMPESPACHSTSQEWAATIDAILRANGHEGFL